MGRVLGVVAETADGGWGLVAGHFLSGRWAGDLDHEIDKDPRGGG